MLPDDLRPEELVEPGREIEEVVGADRPAAARAIELGAHEEGQEVGATVEYSSPNARP